MTTPPSQLAQLAQLAQLTQNGTFNKGEAAEYIGMSVRTLPAPDREIIAFEAMASPVRLIATLTLTLTEASLLSGLSRSHLREEIEGADHRQRLEGEEKRSG